MASVELCEVGPRDGLQNEAQVLTVQQKASLIDQLAACGFSRIEAVSFVNPRRVPQMAGAEEVMGLVERRPGTSYVGLAANDRGGARAVDCGVDRINFAFPVTDRFSEMNQGRPVAATMLDFEKVGERAREAGIPCTVTLGASFGCPFEGEVAVEKEFACLN